jgi:hypothetical protein
MAEQNPPLFLTVDNQYDGADLGLPYRDLLSEGVVGANDCKVSQRAAGANMSVDVADGDLWILGDTDPDRQPLYRCANIGVVNLAVPAADAANPRADLVVAEVLDAAFAGVQLLWRFRYIAGVPAAVPALPALPASAISLARVDVPALDAAIQDAQITDLRPVATVGGGQARSAGGATRAFSMLT